MTLDVVLAIAIVAVMVGLAILLERRMSGHRREAQAARRTLEVRVAERIADLHPGVGPGPGFVTAPRDAGSRPTRSLLQAPATWSDETWITLGRTIAALLLLVSIGLMAFPALESLLGRLLAAAPA